MGQTLEKAAKWTSAKEGCRGKLEYTPANEAILNKIIRFIEDYSESNPTESELQFKQPLVWETELRTADISGGDFETT